MLQSTQHQQINIGNVSNENFIIPTNSSNYFSQPQSGLTLIHSSSAATAVALANADPSTPIRAIVSRGLVDQGINIKVNINYSFIYSIKFIVNLY